MRPFRVRFAPSPTGPLHIGGVRTALYNYLLARKTGGTFILRVEDTDQTRYVPGAEDYIISSLKWFGLLPSEGPGFGGEFGPYRQSERKEHYAKYAHQLIESGHAYYAFDTPEGLDEMRARYKEAGNHNVKYDAVTRMEMTNSLTLSSPEVKQRLDDGVPYTIRIKIDPGDTVLIRDQIRGEVRFQTEELDDKIMLKSDGMPTYHLANIVDDYFMKISHVIRGEEWLPSTAHHVLLYRFLGWEDAMPAFAHLPLILKPSGKGKLSKRDGTKLGIPVFPLAWDGGTAEDSFLGFKEFGFLPEAVLNFLAFLGWNPGTEQELFSLEELAEAFSIERINKAGARFDYDKALWFNQQYLINTSNEALAKLVRPIIEKQGHYPDENFLVAFCGMLKERVNLLPEFWEQGYYFFEPVKEYEEKTIRKRYKKERRPKLEQLWEAICSQPDFSAASIEAATKSFGEANEMGLGQILPVFRIVFSGTMKGPSVFEMMALLGKEECDKRFKVGLDYCDSLK